MCAVLGHAWVYRVLRSRPRVVAACQRKGCPEVEVLPMSVEVMERVLTAKGG